METSSETVPNGLPGFGFPLTHRAAKMIPIALFQQHDEGYEAAVLPTREYTMMEVMNRLTDKPGWETKVFNSVIVEKWKAEVLAMPEQDISEKMFDYCIAELQYKSSFFNTSGCVEALDGVWKCDTISSDLMHALQKAIKVLEDVPAKDRDWHPGSNEQVLDLVHPSIYPLVYGQTRILANEKINLEQCMDRLGEGELCILPETERDQFQLRDNRWSCNYQWLPSDFDIPDRTTEARITSYINNLHPEKHQDLYKIIEEVVALAVPLWNLTLAPLLRPWKFEPRLELEERGYEYADRPGQEEDEPAQAYNERLQEWMNKYERPDQYDDEDDDDHWARVEAWETARKIVHPEPKPFRPPMEKVQERWKIAIQKDPNYLTKNQLDLRKDFAKLQIIVKLANIHLTPEKPSYEGGSWHVEGMANESIVSTALYYYDCENISESLLASRQNVEGGMGLDYEQGDFRAVEEIYGFVNEGPAVQDLGKVVCREGRLLTFPNTMQHRVHPFRLADPSRPGHRKILALFLVDPNQRIISTANVPCQQKSWWEEKVRGIGPLGALPDEMTNHVLDLVEFPVSMDKAKEQRLELMEERKGFVKEREQELEQYNTFNLCEH